MKAYTHHSTTKLWALLASALLLKGMLSSPVGAQSQLADTQSTADQWRKDWEEGPFVQGRIGFIDKAGVLRVRLRYPPEANRHSAWIEVARDAKDFQLLDDQIAVRKSDDSLWLSSGQLNQPLYKIDEHVAAYQLTWLGVGILDTRGAFKFSQDGFPARMIATGINAFQVLHTGRIGVLGDNGVLWLSLEGGQTRGLGFRKVAERVESFQLEREWVAIVTNDGSATLKLAKGENADTFDFTAVAFGVTDYEMEITVELRDDFPGRIHMAAIDSAGTVLIGESDQPHTLGVAAVKNLRDARLVRWASRQLAVQNGAGELQIAKLGANGRLSDFTALGVVLDFQINEDPSLLIAQPSGALSLMGQRIVEQPRRVIPSQGKLSSNSNDQQEGSDKSFMVDGLDLTNVKAVVAGSEGKRVGISKLGVSSRLQPGFGRRAIRATGIQPRAADVVFHGESGATVSPLSQDSAKSDSVKVTSSAG